MFARIRVMRALNRHVERVFNPDRKEHHWGPAETGEGSRPIKRCLFRRYVRRAGSSANYTGPANANQTLTQLIAVLDRQDVAHAIERLEKGHEFRDVVK